MNKLIYTILILSLLMTACGVREEDDSVFDTACTDSDSGVQGEDPTSDVLTLLEGEETVPSNDNDREAVEEKKVIIRQNQSKPAFSEEYLIDTATLIIRGEIVSMDSSGYSNPDGTVLKADGDPLTNSFDNYYTVRIIETLRGNVQGDTVTVKTKNLYGLPVYDESKYVFEGDMDIFNLDEGKEAVMYLRLDEYNVAAGAEPSYICLGGEYAVFYRVENDTTNTLGVNNNVGEVFGSEYLTFDINTLRDKLNTVTE